MHYRQIPPPDHLKDQIRYFWILESHTEDPSKAFRTMADGSPGLIFQHPDKGVMYQNDKQLPGIFVYGQATRHAEIRLTGKFSTIGIYFYPHALKSIFGLNAETLTDSCVNLDLLTTERGFRISEQLANIETFADQIDVLASYLSQLITKSGQDGDAAMQHALFRIIQSKGGISLVDLREELQLSERSFERKFKQYVGVTPKLFSRISRFQASLSQLRSNDFDKLSDIAFGNDYADQSHFIRSFKEFAGFSPYQLRKNATEVMENFSQLIK